MDFKTFGMSDKPPLMLIHGLGMTWQCFKEIIPLLEEDYFLILPVLDGHNPQNHSTFQSVSDTAEKIETYIDNNFQGHLASLLGFSLGGTIVIEMLTRQKVKFDQVILDSPCLETMGIFKRTYASMWISQLNKFVKGKDISGFLKKVNGSHDVSNYYLSLFFHLSPKTIQNACREAYSYPIPAALAEVSSRMVYWHGDRDANATGSAKAMKVLLPSMRIRIFGGLGQGELLMRFPLRYSAQIRNFLNPETQPSDNPGKEQEPTKAS